MYLQALVQNLLSIPFAGLLLFLPAGTFAYWQAWIFIAVVFVCNLALTAYFALFDPKLLERRMKIGPASEQEPVQKIIVSLVFATFIAAVAFSALDHRFGWSEVPASVVIAGNALIVAAYLGFYIVFRENTFGAATVQVERDQTVIPTGPYSLVRHPIIARRLS